MLRLFVGIALPEEARAVLAALAGGLPGARWVAPENMHLTLRFVGEVDDDLAEDLDAALAGVPGAPFDLTLNGLGAFESRNRVRAVWVAAEAGPELPALQARVESAAVRAGFAPESRKFMPHVTVARLKNAPSGKVTPYLERNGGFRSGPFTVTDFQLFRSHLGKAGPRYEVLADYPLSSRNG